MQPRSSIAPSQMRSRRRGCRHPRVPDPAQEVGTVYYLAVEAFLRATLKTDRVFIFDHAVHKRVEGAPDIRDGGPRQPATRVVFRER